MRPNKRGEAIKLRALIWAAENVVSTLAGTRKENRSLLDYDAAEAVMRLRDAIKDAHKSLAVLEPKPRHKVAKE